MATLNSHKVREIADFFAGSGIEILPLSRFSANSPREDGKSFAENALIKARYGQAVSGLPALGDDSGLEVDSLLGAPGIYSARYAGAGSDAANNEKLLAEMAFVPPEKRGARFRCVMALVGRGEPLVCQGLCEGAIAKTPAGSGGFGYDPLFFLPQRSVTMAQLPLAEKNKISHRARALIALKQEMKRRGWLR